MLLLLLLHLFGNHNVDCWFILETVFLHRQFCPICTLLLYIISDNLLFAVLFDCYCCCDTSDLLSGYYGALYQTFCWSTLYYHFTLYLQNMTNIKWYICAFIMILTAIHSFSFTWSRTIKTMIWTNNLTYLFIHTNFQLNVKIIWLVSIAIDHRWGSAHFQWQFHGLPFHWNKKLKINIKFDLR